MSDKRLSGNQLVVIALAVCAALVLAPIGVYAAAVREGRVWSTRRTPAEQ